MSALPATGRSLMAAPPDDCTEAAPPPPSELDITRAIALLLEDLLTEDQFMALTGIDAHTIPQRLADRAAMADVQRTAMQMRNSGTLARLEAARHARAAVEVAAQIMSDAEMHPSQRMSAATFIARAAGTEKPAIEQEKKSDNFKIIINIGKDVPPVVIEATPVNVVNTEQAGHE